MVTLADYCFTLLIFDSLKYFRLTSALYFLIHDKK